MEENAVADRKTLQIVTCTVDVVPLVSSACERTKLTPNILYAVYQPIGWKCGGHNNSPVNETVHLDLKAVQVLGSGFGFRSQELHIVRQHLCSV